MQGIDQAGCPQWAGVRTGIAVRVKGIDAVPFRGHEDNIVDPFIHSMINNMYIGHIERLRVDVSIHRLRK